MPFTQAERPLRVKTSLGEDVLLLNSFQGSEGVSRLFHFQLEMLSENLSIDLKALLGKPVVVSILLPDETSERHIHGLISRMTQLEYSKDGLAAYQAEVVPWLWLLSKFTNCRIFQNLSVQEIVEQVFRDRNFPDFKFQLQGSYPKRDYCVQYRETDLNFVSRLLEEEGIFYFFEQTKEKHTLVLADSKSAFSPCPDQGTARYASVSGVVHDDDTVFSWEKVQELRVGKISLTDYDFEKPKTSLDATVSGELKGEKYDYPGRYRTKAEGDRYAKIRLEEEEVDTLRVKGESKCRAFIAGYKFTLSEHYRDQDNQEYTLISVKHQARNTSYRSGSEDTFDYTNTFEAIPSSVPFRPPQLARKPVIEGSQTAVVVGKSGEEIYVDKYGRVKVQFHWDREGQYDENSSCWVRVAHNWAGKRWGTIYTPRIGQEVIVDFLEGDPDQPIITGRVYNADQMPPYTLPDEQTKSTIKSLSSKGGGGFNEFRFEDKKGSEQIFLNAERNLDIRVKKDLFETIKEERHLKIEKDQLEKVAGDKHLQVTGDKNEKVDGTVSLKAGMDMQEKVGMNYALDAGMEIHLKAGVNLVVESGTNLTLKVGGNFINLNPAGVFITGTMVFINSGGSAGSGAGSSPQAPKDPQEATTAEPGEISQTPSPESYTPDKYGAETISPAARAMRQAAQNGTPFCEH